MSSVVISGDTSGAITVAAPAVAGTNTATLPVATGEVSMLGTDQTWQSFTVGTNRISGTTYTNTTGKPIVVSINVAISAGSYSWAVNGVVQSTSNSAAGSFQISTIIPPNSTYAMTFVTVGTTRWFELR
jgi:hypothetical protein